FVADNFSASGLTAARLYAGGADHRLQLERLPHLALLASAAADYAVADEAAASAALATGRAANKGSLRVRVDGRAVRTLAGLARERGRSVGFVTNGRLASPLFGAMIPGGDIGATGPEIAAALAQWKDIQVGLGGGAADFLPEHKGGARTDGRDLALEMRASGFDVLRGKLELENTPPWRAAKILGLFAEEGLAFSDDLARATAQPSLVELVRQAIQLLQVNRRGYLLVVEAALAGDAARSNNAERVLRELIQLDAAVAEALAYAGDNALVVVAGRVVPGGLRLNGFPLRNDKGLALLGSNPQGIPAITWSTGPGGSPEAPGSEPSAVPESPAVPVAEDALAVGSGPGTEALSGFRSATDIFALLAGQL
ncbi:MAG: alkaline phosphatase, partial [Terrimicrobiaceae bacterium]|nr:alkaline phosphatase [Terrimicrobiaceae bacterium]